jgi:2-polyprenyl-3-methyl-5-hydroxy-6-metoxy-1,4-benzoquinol methylase
MEISSNRAAPQAPPRGALLMKNLLAPGGYDAEFIAQLYRICLAREPDAGGFETHLHALRSGVPPHELVLNFLYCEEFAARWRQKFMPQFELPNLKELYPSYFADEIYLATNDERINLMEQLIIENRYYDNFGVWGDTIDYDKRNMANLVLCIGAKDCLEIGCFNGTILSILKCHGLNVTGLDLSHLAFLIALPNIRNNLHYGDLLTVNLDKRYDCILLLDVMEHINPLKIGKYICRLRSLLKLNGVIILNSPMFGIDSVFGTVFPQALRQWRDLGDETFFRHWPCDPKGWPLHGHMIWASPNWWSKQFDDYDLTRRLDIEQVIQTELAQYFLSAPARKTLAVFQHRDGEIDADRICEAIQRQHWLS